VDAYGTISMNSNKITDLGTPTATTDAATKGYVDTQLSSSSHNFTFVGDDSTGTAVTQGETFKFAGATGITTAVSGDTLTITGPDLSNYLQNTGTQTIDNLSFNDNIISTSSNSDLILQPGGTGDVVAGAIRINSSAITSIGTNADITITPNGTGNIILDSITLADNKITTNRSNDNLILAANGTGGIVVAESSSKLGFFGTTPVAQQSAIAFDPAGNDGSTVEDLRTTINNILTVLRNYGLIAS